MRRYHLKTLGLFLLINLNKVHACSYFGDGNSCGVEKYFDSQSCRCQFKEEILISKYKKLPSYKFFRIYFDKDVGSRFFSSEKDFMKLYLKLVPSNVTIKTGVNRNWQTGTMRTNNNSLIQWKTCSKDYLTFIIDGREYFFATSAELSI